MRVPAEELEGVVVWSAGLVGVSFGRSRWHSDEVDVQVSDGRAVSILSKFHVNAITLVNVAPNDETLSSAPEGDLGTFRVLAGEDGHFHFDFPDAASPAAEVHANDVAVLHLNQGVAADAVPPGNAPTAMVHSGLFGDAIALYDLHPLAHAADYFMV